MSRDAAFLINEIEGGLKAEPVGRVRLYMQIAARIEALIVSGKLQPGDSLPSERDLMQLFSVGRPSVREALFELQRKGLIASRNGSRPVVASPTSDVIFSTLSGSVGLYLATERGMRDFQRGRRILETAITREAALKATKRDLARLEKAMEENRKAMHKPGELVRSDVAFHLAIAAIVGSELVYTLYCALDRWLSEQRAVSAIPIGSREATIKAHQTIFEAIKRRDPEEAGAAMASHLEEVEAFYWTTRNGTESDRGSVNSDH